MIIRFLALLTFLSFGLSGCYLGKISSATFENPLIKEDNPQDLLTRLVSVSTAIPFEIEISEPRNAKIIGSLMAQDIMDHSQITGTDIGKLKNYMELKNPHTNKAITKDDVTNLRTTLGAFNVKDGKLIGTINITVENFILTAKSKLEKEERKTKSKSKELGDLKFKIVNNGLSEHTIKALLDTNLIEKQFAKEIKKDKDGNYNVTVGPMSLWFDSSISKKNTEK